MFLSRDRFADCDTTTTMCCQDPAKPQAVAKHSYPQHLPSRQNPIESLAWDKRSATGTAMY